MAEKGYSRALDLFRKFNPERVADSPSTTELFDWLVNQIERSPCYTRASSGRIDLDGRKYQIAAEYGCSIRFLLLEPTTLKPATTPTKKGIIAWIDWLMDRMCQLGCSFYHEWH
ncbi:MAG: hypothetical protein JW987_00635 [Anaerolineaceae bacterium]|nr:hypothetical protein [Anaerolineaceae bacterium]